MGGIQITLAMMVSHSMYTYNLQSLVIHHRMAGKALYEPLRGMDIVVLLATWPFSLIRANINGFGMHSI